jgi:hypothetical protein
VGALSHYLEQAGIPTTQISLIYEHTETIRPPRALWVPFELGRPLGVPDDAVFQKKVLLAALLLLEAETGPVLEIFPEEAPAPAAGKAAAQDAWACPISFSSPAGEETDLETRIRLLKREVAELRTWYDIGVKKRGRTAVADFDPETAAGILCDYLSGKDIDIVRKEISPAVAIRLATQDLKSFYFEAAISRPGAEIPGSATFTHWYWTQTAASRILKDVSKKLAGEDDQDLQITGKRFLIPMGQ